MRPKMMFKLAQDGAHPFCDEGGAILGDGVALLEKDAYGRWSPRPQAQLESLLSLGYGGPVELSSRMGWLRQVAKYLNDGKVGQAGIALLHAQLPPLPSREAARRMAKADRLGKLNPYRVPAGATYARGGEYDRAPGGVGLEYASSKPKETPEERAAREKQQTEDENRRKAARQAKLRAENETYLKNPNVLALLDTISEAEGHTEYHSLFGDKGKQGRITFSDDKHYPYNTLASSASGRYQILEDNYERLSGQLGLTDFSKKTQDLMAVQILRNRHVLDEVASGDIKAALPSLSAEWSSLPDPDKRGDKQGYYGPITLSIADVEAMFQRHLTARKITTEGQD